MVNRMGCGGSRAEGGQKSARERLEERDRLVRRVGDLTDEELAAIAVAEVSPEARQFEDEHG